MALVLDSASPQLILEEQKNNMPGGKTPKAATLAAFAAMPPPPPPPPPPLSKTTATKAPAATAAAADVIQHVPVELLVVETPSEMAADMEVGEPPVALKTPTLQAALASGCITNSSSNNNNNNKAMIPTASGPLVANNSTTTTTGVSPVQYQRSGALACGSPELQQLKSSASASSAVLRSTTPDPTSSPPSLLEPNVAVEILARHSLSFTKKKNNSFLDNTSSNQDAASGAVVTSQLPDHTIPTTTTTTAAAAAAAATTASSSQVQQQTLISGSEAATAIVVPSGAATQPSNKQQQQYHRQAASSSAGNLIDDLTCFVCSERSQSPPQQDQQQQHPGGANSAAAALAKPAKTTTTAGSTPKPLIRQPTPPQHRERPTRIPTSNHANQKQQQTPPPSHSSNESIATINTNTIGGTCNPMTPINECVNNEGEQNGIATAAVQQGGPNKNNESPSVESAKSRTISFLSVFTKPLLACSADLPDQIKKVQSAVGTVVNGGLEGVTSKHSDLSYVDSFEIDEIMQLQRMTSWNTLETNNTIYTEYSDEGDARAAAAAAGESNVYSPLGSPAALSSSTGSSDGNLTETPGAQQPIRLDDDGNPIPAVLIDLTLEMREQRAKSVRRKRLVKFSYPPISSLKECPRPDPADLPRLYFSEEELNQIEDDRESTFTADDVEVVCVSTSDSGHENHHQNNNKGGEGQQQAQQQQTPKHDSLATAGSTGDDSHHPSFPHLGTPRAGQMWSSKKKTTTFVDTSAADKQADTDNRGRPRQRPGGDSRKKPKRPHTPGPGGRSGSAGNSSNQQQRTDTLSNVGSDSSAGEKRLIKSVQIYLRERSRERCTRP